MRFLFVRVIAEKLPPPREAQTFSRPKAPLVNQVEVPGNQVVAAINPLEPAARFSSRLIRNLFLPEHFEPVSRPRYLPKDVDVKAIADISKEPRNAPLIRSPRGRIRPSLPVPFIPVAGVIRRLEPPEPTRQIAVSPHKERKHRRKHAADDCHYETDRNQTNPLEIEHANLDDEHASGAIPVTHTYHQRQFLGFMDTRTKKSPELSPEGVVVDLVVDWLRAGLRGNETCVDAEFAASGDLHGFTLSYRDRHSGRTV